MAGQSRLQLAKTDIAKTFDRENIRVFWPSDILTDS